MLPYSVLWIFLIIGISNGNAHEVVEFDVSESKVFSASLECSPRYTGATEKIECQFNLKNNGPRDFSVLKWHTPLEGLTSDSLSVTRNGNKIPYDGIFKKRSTPGPDEFLLLTPGKSVSRKFDVFEGYDVSRTATYFLTVDTYLEYAEGSVKGMNKTGKLGSIKISHLSSPTVIFQVVGRKTGNGTPGQKARSLERENNVGNSQKSSKALNVPLDPVVVGTADQQKWTKEIHRAAYHYIKSAISDLQSSPDRVKAWFGKTSSGLVLQKFKLMERLLRSDIITYVFKSDKCKDDQFGFTWKGTRTVYFCKLYEEAPTIVAYDSKMSTIVHELAHCLAYVDDVIYGYDCCKNLAETNPNIAANNGNNYNYFVSTLFPFNYGFDAMTRLSNGYIYVFKGNIYVRYKDSSGLTIDPAYPKLIQGNWGNLPDNFAQGFDSFLYSKVNGHAYATKGSQYISYTNGKASTIKKGYPRDISKYWGVSGIMSKGFDSMVQLKNKRTYATRGNLYVRYTDRGFNKVDDGYPRELSLGWGNLPEKFKTGFDAMEVLPNGKFYVTRGSQYIRYSDSWASTIDSGYPKPIKGYWGDVSQ